MFVLPRAQMGGFSPAALEDSRTLGRARHDAGSWRHSLRVADVGAAPLYLSRDTINKTAVLCYEKGTLIALPYCSENINTVELAKASQLVPFLTCSRAGHPVIVDSSVRISFDDLGWESLFGRPPSSSRQQIGASLTRVRRASRPRAPRAVSREGASSTHARRRTPTDRRSMRGSEIGCNSSLGTRHTNADADQDAPHPPRVR
jgi:hypothetical protein